MFGNTQLTPATAFLGAEALISSVDRHSRFPTLHRSRRGTVAVKVDP